MRYLKHFEEIRKQFKTLGYTVIEYEKVGNTIKWDRRVKHTQYGIAYVEYSNKENKCFVTIRKCEKIGYNMLGIDYVNDGDIFKMGQLVGFDTFEIKSPNDKQLEKILNKAIEIKDNALYYFRNAELLERHNVDYFHDIQSISDLDKFNEEIERVKNEYDYLLPGEDMGLL